MFRSGASEVGWAGGGGRRGQRCFGLGGRLMDFVMAQSEERAGYLSIIKETGWFVEVYLFEG